MWSVSEQKATVWYCIIPGNFSADNRHILQGLQHVAAIQDDILITGKDDGQDIQNLSTVLSRLDSYAWLTTPTLQVQVHAEVSNLYGLRHFRCRNLPNRGEG